MCVCTALSRRFSLASLSLCTPTSLHLAYMGPCQLQGGPADLATHLALSHFLHCSCVAPGMLQRQQSLHACRSMHIQDCSLHSA